MTTATTQPGTDEFGLHAEERLDRDAIDAETAAAAKGAADFAVAGGERGGEDGGHAWWWRRRGGHGEAFHAVGHLFWFGLGGSKGFGCSW